MCFSDLSLKEPKISRPLRKDSSGPRSAVPHLLPSKPSYLRRLHDLPLPMQGLDAVCPLRLPAEVALDQGGRAALAWLGPRPRPPHDLRHLQVPLRGQARPSSWYRVAWVGGQPASWGESEDAVRPEADGERAGEAGCQAESDEVGGGEVRGRRPPAVGRHARQGGRRRF